MQVHTFSPPASTTPPSPAQTSASLPRSPNKKSLPKPHLTAGYGGTQLQAALAVGLVVSHPIPVSALQCVGPIAGGGGAEVDERKINLREEEGNENNTQAGNEAFDTFNW